MQGMHLRVAAVYPRAICGVRAVNHRSVAGSRSARGAKENTDMLTIISTAIAATTLGTPGHHYTTYYPTRNDGRHLATARPYPANIVDSTARPGFNGRVWIGREIVGGTDHQRPSDW